MNLYESLILNFHEPLLAEPVSLVTSNWRGHPRHRHISGLCGRSGRHHAERSQEPTLPSGLPPGATSYSTNSHGHLTNKPETDLNRHIKYYQALVGNDQRK